jgi:hypothetical protein
MLFLCNYTIGRNHMGHWVGGGCKIYQICPESPSIQYSGTFMKKHWLDLWFFWMIWKIPRKPEVCVVKNNVGSFSLKYCHYYRIYQCLLLCALWWSFILHSGFSNVKIGLWLSDLCYQVKALKKPGMVKTITCEPKVPSAAPAMNSRNLIFRFSTVFLHRSGR